MGEPGGTQEQCQDGKESRLALHGFPEVVGGFVVALEEGILDVEFLGDLWKREYESGSSR